MDATVPAGVTARLRRFADDHTDNDHLWALVAAIQTAETRAAAAASFGELYRLTYPTVYRFVRSKVDNHPTAEDLTADTFERAYKRMHGITRQTGSPAAWLVTIARNLVSDHYKSARVRLTQAVDDVTVYVPAGHGGAEHDLDLTAAAVTDAMMSVQQATALLGAVTRLSPEQMDAVNLRYLHNCSVAETAEKLGKLEGAIKALTYRAIRALARDPEVAALNPARFGLVA